MAKLHIICSGVAKRSLTLGTRLLLSSRPSLLRTPCALPWNLGRKLAFAMASLQMILPSWSGSCPFPLRTLILLFLLGSLTLMPFFVMKMAAPNLLLTVVRTTLVIEGYVTLASVSLAEVLPHGSTSRSSEASFNRTTKRSSLPSFFSLRLSWRRSISSMKVSRSSLTTKPSAKSPALLRTDLSPPLGWPGPSLLVGETQGCAHCLSPQKGHVQIYMDPCAHLS